MAEPARVPRIGYLYVICATLMWAVHGSVAKYLFNRGHGALDMVQIRVTLAAVVLLVWFLLKDRAALRIGREDLVLFASLGVFGMATNQFAYFYAVSKIQVVAALLLQYMCPAMIAAYAVLVAREPLKPLVAAALAGSMAGCYLVVGGYDMDLLAMNLAGIAGGLTAALGYATYSILGERAMRRHGPWTVHLWGLIFAAIVWNVLHPPLSAFFLPWTPLEWGCLAFIAVFGTVVPFGLYFTAVGLIRATRASITATIEPFFAGLIAYAALGETLALPQLAGGMIVLASVVLLQLRGDHDEGTAHLIRARAQAAAREGA